MITQNTDSSCDSPPSLQQKNDETINAINSIEKKATTHTLKCRRRRVFLVALAALTVLLIGISMSLNFPRRNVLHNGMQWRLVSTQPFSLGDIPNAVVMRNSDGNKAVLCLYRSMQRTGARFDVTTRAVLRFLDYEIIRTSSDSTRDVHYSFSDYSFITINERNPRAADMLTRLQSAEMRFIESFMNIQTQRQREITPYIRMAIIGLGLAFISLGLAHIIHAEEMWRLRYYFVVRDGEPTELALLLNVVAGLILIVLGFVLNIAL